MACPPWGRPDASVPTKCCGARRANGYSPVEVRAVDRDGTRMQAAGHPLDRLWSRAVLLPVAVGIVPVRACDWSLRPWLVLEPALAIAVVPHVVTPAQPSLAEGRRAEDEHVARLRLRRALLVRRLRLRAALAHHLPLERRTVQVHPPPAAGDAHGGVRFA
eukprot:CAMPEP_0182838396 /NCGR_PEP_ID=MMETSP0006_2-20121128/23283_1 /TAXON_ID=97485 /ORGANISM="Prymnesium parvum, Strain Texoma1" /LENGTH=160 /DNA_ID=CAMNT_0024967421 /DNA_START=91 /DNA_END=569 /DNA_ORIENTATION=+